MDDYSISSLIESKNEWCARLVTILTHCIVTGIKSIYDEAIKLCIDNEEENKYLMTFQNLLTQVPQWNPTIIETERKRIEKSSGCKYLEDLITCVHIIQLKALTCIRVGQKQKKVDIDIPSVDKFIHQIYINSARKLYTTVYLFEKDIMPLQHQKNNRELERVIQESILLTIRENIPVDKILRTYMEETEEHTLPVEQPLQMDNKQDITSSTPTDLSATNQVIDSPPGVEALALNKDEMSPPLIKNLSAPPQIGQGNNKPGSTTPVQLDTNSTIKASDSSNSLSAILDDLKNSKSPESLSLPNEPSPSPLLSIDTNTSSVTNTMLQNNDNDDANDDDNKKRTALNFSPVDNVITPDGKEEVVNVSTKPPTNSIYTNNSVEDDTLNIGEAIDINLGIESL